MTMTRFAGQQRGVSVNGDGNLAVFCDFENVARGVRDAKYPEFDIRQVIERLLRHLASGRVATRPPGFPAACDDSSLVK